ncbi:PadR family transcriptional regulator [Flexivirga sp.]|uniref:PadR family transcriptional regulator n=1 Tax=Flexivirga sp. TaxID=1962927 RepID=UPI003F813848
MPSKPAARAGDAGAISTAGLGVLGVVAEAPTHGFAVAAVFAADGALGRVWRVQRAVVYRELGRLADAGLVQPVGVETDGPGPDRTIVQLTAHGRGTLDRWLDAPVRRPRDARSELLLKLALLDRAGRDAGTLIAAQRTVFAARLTELRAAVRATESGSFDHTLALWRVSSTQAVLDFLRALDAS